MENKSTSRQKTQNSHPNPAIKFNPNNTNININATHSKKYEKTHHHSATHHGSMFQSVSKASTYVSASTSNAIVMGSLSCSMSCFDYSIQRQDLNTAITTLNDIKYDILAIWVVSKPIERMKATKWGHWAVKLHAAPALVSIDFFEDNGHGNFGIEAVCASLAELNDFFHYYVTENDVHQRKQWKILSPVVPRFKTNNTNNMNMDVETTSERIKCNKKVSDIATFLQEWTRERKSYNTFKSNCQTFCIALYEYLVKEHYPEKIKQLCQYLQSPFDQSQFGNHLKTSKKNNDNDNDNDLHVSQHVKKKY